MLIVSIGLRFGLVRYNIESNDDHVQVIRLILTTGNLPEISDCWECFQPKFFHYAVAMFLQSMGLDRTGPDTMALAVELINFTAGLITMLVVGILISRLPLKNETLKVLSFGLVALNPKLIGINSQATNDTFVILFCTLTLFCTVFFLQKQKPGTFLLILFFTLLSISSKTNGWIIAFVITLALFTKAWVQEKHRLGLVLTGFLFMAATVTISILNPLNQYIPNY